MALFGRSPRYNERRPSSYGSTATLIVFVALCLVGVWMMTSSTAPANMPSSNKSEMKQQVPETGSTTPEDRSMDGPGNVQEGAANADVNDSSGDNSTDSPDDQNVVDKTAGSAVEKPKEEIPKEENPASTTTKNQTYDDENGKMESGELVKEAREEAGSREDVQDKNIVKNPEGNTNGGTEKEEESSYESANGEEIKNSDKMKKKAESSEESTNGEEPKNSDTDSGETKADEQAESEGERTEGEQKKSDTDEQGQAEDRAEENQDKAAEKNTNPTEEFPNGAQSELLSETATQNGVWSTQTAESKNEKEVQASSSTEKKEAEAYNWKLCNATAGADYIPCLDNVEAIKKLSSTKHYEHRERHCPDKAPTCLVPLPEGYKQSIEWPNSRDKIWYNNVPHSKLADVKGHQNWVKVSGEYLSFPGGGTQFKHGALHYIDVIQESFPDIAWGKRSRVVLDVGCGVASFGGYLFERDVLTMSFAPKDEHEAQVQFALERGIPAISAVMGTKRLPFPSGVFDIVHCARCRVPWHIEGGMLLLELNRVLRPGGFFVWSATPVYQKLQEDVQIWNAMTVLTKSMCWSMMNKTKDSINKVGLVIFRKPSNNECYEKRKEKNPPLCQESDDPNAAWNISLQACMHRLPVDPTLRGTQWPKQWPLRLEKAPYWLNDSQVGVYGKPAPTDFEADYEHWKNVVTNSYVNGMGINWSRVRNVMDMRAVYGGFAAALRDRKVWVMNVVTINSPDTLPVIYERGLFGIYHDWCESFSTYPRTYDLLHADHLFSKLKERCKLLPVMAEADRILRPNGKLIVRDDVETANEIERIAGSLHWEVRMIYSKDNKALLCLQKTMWRPTEVEAGAAPLS